MVNSSYDNDFLVNLTRTRNKILYARITALNFSEQPLQTITGRATQGSINVDGTSAVRRTCSLTLVSNASDYKDYYWGSDYIYGISIVRSLQTEALGVIDRDGNIILPPKYKRIDILSNQTIRVIGKSLLCTIFDLSGKCIRKYKPRTSDEIEDYILIGKDPYDDSAKIVYSDDLWDKEEYDEDDIEDYYPEYDEEE